LADQQRLVFCCFTAALLLLYCCFSAVLMIYCCFTAAYQAAQEQAFRRTSSAFSY
jgi:hypothetical protein